MSSSPFPGFRPARLRLGLVAVIVVVVGLGFAVAAGFIYVTTADFLAGAERAEGTVVGLEERTSTRRINGTTRRTISWAPVVQFTAEGRSYEFTGGTATDPPRYDEGETVTVRYDPADPSEARIESFVDLYLLPLIFGLVGLVLTGAGGTLGAVTIRRTRRRAWLRQHGQPVDGQVTHVEESRVRRNRRRLYRVHAAWQDSRGQWHTARSEPVWPDPSPFLPIGHPVRVLVDPADPARHLMELPQPSGQPGPGQPWPGQPWPGQPGR